MDINVENDNFKVNNKGNINVNAIEIYPLNLRIKRDVKNNHYDYDDQIMIIDGTNAIDLQVTISDSHFKKDIKKELFDIFQTILRHFREYYIKIQK